MIKDQEQTASEGSIALQASGDIVITQGLTYTEVREVALDIFRANFFHLRGIAMETAAARAEEVTEEFLKKLQQENPTGFDQANDPGFQAALITVQREHARNGDKDLGSLLVDLLVDRSKQKQRDILQIVLDESLNTAPKLTESQLAVLSVAFLFKYTQNQSVGTHDMLGAYFDKHVMPFQDKLVKNRASYQHLEFTGCGSISIGEMSLATILGTTYQGLFLKGFSPEEITKRDLSIGLDPRYFLYCLNDQSKIQVKTNSHETLEQMFNRDGINQDDREKLKQLFDLEKMTDQEIQAKCIEIRPYMATVFDVWNDSPLKNFSLTSVGIAIAHANIQRLIGKFADLSIWIN